MHRSLGNKDQGFSERTGQWFVSEYSLLFSKEFTYGNEISRLIFCRHLTDWGSSPSLINKQSKLEIWT